MLLLNTGADGVINNELLSSSTPGRMILPPEVSPAAVSCGAEHTLVLMTDGSVYATGRNHRSRLGLGSNVQFISTPAPITFPEPDIKIIHICAGALQSVAVDVRGRVYTWGGPPATDAVQEVENARAYPAPFPSKSPIQVQLPAPALTACVGRARGLLDNSFFGCAALVDNSVWCCEYSYISLILIDLFSSAASDSDQF